MPKTRLIGAWAIALAGFLGVIYWPGLHGGFFFDDEPSILLAEGIRITSLSLDSLHQAWLSGGAGPSGRPIAQLSFALNYFFSGFNPFVFKATNLAIHLINGGLVFAIARLLLTAAQPLARQRDLLMTSATVAALWLLHPIQLLPVLLVVQRMTTLSALFLLAAVWLHIQGRQRGGLPCVLMLLPAWLLLWPLSFLSKETGVLFPVFVLVWELILHRSSQGRLDRFARVFATLAGICAVVVMAYMLSPRAQWLWAGFEMRSFSLIERLLTEGRVLWFYLGLMVLPQLEAFGLYHDDIAVSTGWLSPWTTLPALLGLAALVWLAWWLRRRAPLVSFGIAWFFVGHALESTVLPLELVHEHRNYLPLFGVLLAGGWGLLQSLQSKGERKTMGVALALAALAYFPFVTALRSNQFSNDGLRTQIEAQHHRNSPRAQYEAGRVLAGLPDAASGNSPTYSFALRHYQIAGELDPAFKMGWLGMIHLSCQAGRTPPEAWVTELAHRLQSTPFAPGDRTVLYSLKEMADAGTICLNRSEIDRIFAAALANPGVGPGVAAMLHSWHADYLWLHEKDMPAARAALATSLKLNPGNPSNRLKWAQLIYLDGERDAARQLLLVLRDQNLTSEEQNTLKELLATYTIAKP
ncbi:pilus assembly protein PilF [Rhodoferax sp.]|uniref:pilus assembly protein PilF n=1 Tax=Rhodoferax sp. TaxID=50421 RepID=UPI00284182F3|nr:pilus assembly protein PilF [Rhodoferax sp.]MDR3371652.1 pilus assembly protein PilF [Rhodoferax sp.]